METNYIHEDVPGGVPVKMWTRGVPVEDKAKRQLTNAARLPIVFKHIAAMPDVHFGIGATVGSVIPTLKAIIPAAVGVDIGCGVIACKTTLTAEDLPDNLAPLRSAIERAVPHGRSPGARDPGAWGKVPGSVDTAWAQLEPDFTELCRDYPKLAKTNNRVHLGTLGTGNHFIEVCLDEAGFVWFIGFEQWRDARATGADLLWRCSSTRLLPVQQRLADGSFLSVIRPTGVGRAEAAEQAMTVRVIEYALPGVDDGQPRCRLLTTLLDPQRAPAMELAALYHQRWEIEAVFDELKTHLRQSRRVLRSKTPDLVRQEFYGWVLAHYAVRWLLHQGATRHRIPHAELSFKGHVELLRRAQPHSGAFPPRATQTSTTLVP